MLGFLSKKYNKMKFSSVYDKIMNHEITLVDVRTVEEYLSGHVPGSYSIALNEINKIANIISNRDQNVFVYCQSGMRSRRACQALVEMGYSSVTDLGGICEWSGPMERGR